MRNLNKIDDFFAFITDAGEAVLGLCSDPWFSGGGDTVDFLAFICRQKNRMISIAAAGDGVTVEDYLGNRTPAELYARVTEIFNNESVRDFFGLSAHSVQQQEKGVFMTRSLSAESDWSVLT